MSFAFDEARFRANAHLSDRLLGQLFNKCPTWAWQKRRELALSPSRAKVKTMSAGLDAIVGHVAAAHGLTVNDMISKRRHSDVCNARQIAMWIAHRSCHFPLQAVAYALRRADHTTVLHGVNKLERPENHRTLEWAMELAETIKREYPYVLGHTRASRARDHHSRNRADRASSPGVDDHSLRLERKFG